MIRFQKLLVAFFFAVVVSLPSLSGALAVESNEMNVDHTGSIQGQGMMPSVKNKAAPNHTQSKGDSQMAGMMGGEGSRSPGSMGGMTCSSAMGATCMGTMVFEGVALFAVISALIALTVFLVRRIRGGGTARHR
jgi:hypothetical protein